MSFREEARPDPARAAYSVTVEVDAPTLELLTWVAARERS
jgi:hypothetical protein